MIVKGIGVVFLKKNGKRVRIYRQSITRYSQGDEWVVYHDKKGERLRIVSCMYPADEPEEFYIQGESYKRDKHRIDMSLTRLRSIFTALVFSQDACNMPHTTTLL
jgi:hypothetical protein